MNYRKNALLSIVCIAVLFVFSVVHAGANDVTVSIEKPAHGSLELHAVVVDQEGYVEDIKEAILPLPHNMQKGVETCAVICRPEKGYITSEITYVLTREGGVKEEKKAKILERKDNVGRVVYRFALLLFKADSPITACTIEAKNELNAAQITFKTPSIDEGTLEVSYSWDGKEEKVQSKDVVPLDTDIVLLLTSKDPKRRPNVTYKEVGSENIQTLDLKYYDEHKVWRGVFRIAKPTELMVVYGPDDLMVTFVSPTANKGSLDITYLKDGEEKRLITSGKVMRGTELTLKLTRKSEEIDLKVNYKGEDGKLVPVTLTEQPDKSFVGKIVVNSAIQIFTSFERGTAVAEREWESITIYPNPFSSQFIIKNGTHLVGRYELVTIQGQTVRAGGIESDAVVVDTEDLPLGIYFVRLVAQSGEIRRVRLVKY